MQIFLGPDFATASTALGPLAPAVPALEQPHPVSVTPAGEGSRGGDGGEEAPLRGQCGSPEVRERGRGEAYPLLFWFPVFLLPVPTLGLIGGLKGECLAQAKELSVNISSYH